MSYNGKTVAVVLPTYNEKDSIAECIRGFEALPEVDEIIVVNNNAASGTSDEVATTSAREVHEALQGYGAAILRGLKEADADLICICEPDGTFDPADLQKLLPFMRECDMVLGSRTVATYIWSGANMGWFIRWGNWGVAKLIEVLYGTTSLSDVGCTFRVMTRRTADEVIDRSVIFGSAHGLETMLMAATMPLKMIQVPVNYRPRVGTSSVTGDLGKTIMLGTEMVAHVLHQRVRRAPVRVAQPQPGLTIVRGGSSKRDSPAA